ncbi:MAG: hypothetical protein U0231_17490 [Nitrospiraceae bacterium]
MSHFLFVAGALRERTSQESADLQMGACLWGLRTDLIRNNLQNSSRLSLTAWFMFSRGICAEFAIVSAVQPFTALDDLLKDEFRAEARYGFVQVKPVRRWASSAPECQALLQQVLSVPEQAEFARRLSLGMHRLTEEEYRAIVEGLGPAVQDQPVS